MVTFSFWSTNIELCTAVPFGNVTNAPTIFDVVSLVPVNPAWLRKKTHVNDALVDAETTSKYHLNTVSI